MPTQLGATQFIAGCTLKRRRRPISKTTAKNNSKKTICCFAEYLSRRLARGVVKARGPFDCPRPHATNTARRLLCRPRSSISSSSLLPVPLAAMQSFRSASLVLPELREPPFGQCGIARCRLQIAMTEIVRQRSRIMAIVGQLVSGRVSEHMRVYREG
jgi:hypothetical protein